VGRESGPHAERKKEAQRPSTVRGRCADRGGRGAPQKKRKPKKVRGAEGRIRRAKAFDIISQKKKRRGKEKEVENENDLSDYSLKERNVSEEERRGNRQAQEGGNGRKNLSRLRKGMVSGTDGRTRRADPRVGALKPRKKKRVKIKKEASSKETKRTWSRTLPAREKSAAGGGTSGLQPYSEKRSWRKESVDIGQTRQGRRCFGMVKSKGERREKERSSGATARERSRNEGCKKRNEESSQLVENRRGLHLCGKQKSRCSINQGKGKKMGGQLCQKENGAPSRDKRVGAAIPDRLPYLKKEGGDKARPQGEKGGGFVLP